MTNEQKRTRALARSMPDSPYVSWSALPTRPRLVWPGNARVAFCIIVCVEQVEWTPGVGNVVAPTAVRFGPYPRVFDVHEVSAHEYGNRVGLFRVVDLLERVGVRGALAVDALLAENNPYMIDYCLQRDWEFIAHGVSLSEALHEDMSIENERDYVARAIRAISRATGRHPSGWHSPDYVETLNTVPLLAELGMSYVCDWPNDEQPYAMHTPTGPIWCLPLALELDDVFALRERGVTMQQWLSMVTGSFDRMYLEGEATGLLLALNIHPYIIGHPFRIGYLEKALRHILSRDGVWAATAGEVIDWCSATFR